MSHALPPTPDGAPSRAPAPPTRSARPSRWPVLVMVLLLAAAAAVWLLRARAADRPGAAVVFRVGRPAGLLDHRPPDPAEFDEYRLEQAATVRSRLVLNRALNSLQGKDVPLVDSQPDRLGWLVDNLRVSFSPAPAFLRVELDGEPEQALAVLEALAAAYLAEVDRMENGQRDSRKKILERLRAQHENEKKAYRARAKSLAQRAQMPSARDRAAVEAMAADELRACTEGLRRVRHLRAAYKALAPNGAADADRVLEAWEGLWQADLAAARDRRAQLDALLDEMDEVDRKLRAADEGLRRVEAALAESELQRAGPLRVTVFEPAHARPSR